MLSREGHAENRAFWDFQGETETRRALFKRSRTVETQGGGEDRKQCLSELRDKAGGQDWSPECSARGKHDHFPVNNFQGLIGQC